jgi:malonate transporter
MLVVISSALLPAVVTLFLGYLAAWRGDFGATEAAMLNRMVMNYALPLSLFAGTMAIPRTDLFADVPMALAVTACMVMAFFVVLAIARFICRHDLSTSTLEALVIAMPAIPFVGATVIGTLLGSDKATLPVTAGTLAMNLLLAPLALMLLALGARGSVADASRLSMPSIILSTLREPVVWAPLLAFVFILCGADLPRPLGHALLLLGHGSAGVALFATGIVMFTRRVSFTATIAVNVAARMILAPAAAWGLLCLSGQSPAVVRDVVVMMALPAAALSVIFAVRFKTAEQEMSSTLFFANLVAPFTLGAFIWLSA